MNRGTDWDKGAKLMTIGAILMIIGIWLLSLAIIFAISNAYALDNPCSSCGLNMPNGFVLKITTLKASCPDTLKRWVKDFIDAHKVIKVDNSKFPESVALYYIEKEKIIGK